tara:strand:+ start:12600 stop:13139 length:540 start_codon:yes stop_codon:yes gene_type:complete
MMDADSSAGKLASIWARKGNQAYERERQSFTKGSNVIETNSLRPEARENGCCVDSIISTVGEVEDSGVMLTTCVMETKARFNLSLEKFQTVFDNEMLLEQQKLDSCYKLSRDLKTALWSNTVLVDSLLYMIIPLTDRKGAWITDYYLEDRMCRKSINDPTMILKPCALFDMENAHTYKL